MLNELSFVYHGLRCFNARKNTDKPYFSLDCPEITKALMVEL